MLVFRKTKYDSLDGSTKCRYKAFDESQEMPSQEIDFYIEASRAGIVIHGELPVEDRAKLEPFAKAVSDAWSDHKKFKPQIVTTNLAGH